MKNKKGFFYIVKESFKLAWRFQRKSFSLYVVLAILSGTVTLLQFGSFSLVVDRVIDYVNLYSDSHLSFFAAIKYFSSSFILLGIAYFLPAFLGQWQNNHSIIFVTRFLSSITAYFTAKQATLDAATIELPEYQNKLQQGNEWGRGSISSITNLTILCLSSLISVVVAAIVLGIIEPWFVVIAVVSTIPVYFIQQKFEREIFRIRRLATESKRVIGNRIGIFSFPATLIEIVMFGSTKKYQEEITQLLEQEDTQVVNIRLRQTMWQNISRLLSVLCMLVISVVIITRGANGVIPIGLMVFAFTAYTTFYMSAINLFSNFATAQDSARYALIWLDIFETKPSIISKENPVFISTSVPPKIEFIDVSFSYPGASGLALEKVSLTIEPGTKVGIVGLSGAGKTTFIKLLSRIYDPTEGKILINGIDLRDIDVKNWQKMLGVMHQNFANYNVPIKESIAIGDLSKPIDMERVKWAAAMAGAKDFIEKLPEQYDQLVWKGFSKGVDLSGGEKQRLAIARIFYRGAPISILDEPTSSVDALTAAMIFNNLETKTRGETVSLISHNFSTVKQSDKILVIEHGRIVEEGNHEELYQIKGRYAELYDLQVNAFTK